jgi:hypothetical protein
MTPSNLQRFARRQFLQTVGGLAVGTFGVTLAGAEDTPRSGGSI